MSKPFVVFSSLTENKGHLLLDDDFWFRNLVRYDNRTVVYTSGTSCARLATKYPAFSNSFRSFKDFPWLRKIYYRFHLLGRLISCPRIRNSCIVFQGLDELAMLFYLFRIRKWNNTTVLVLTNNVSPERLQRSRWLLQTMLRRLAQKADFVYYHTDFEYRLLETFISPSLLQQKFRKIKYHLIGFTPEDQGTTKPTADYISFFGPVLASKPLDDICRLISADTTGKFCYRFLNISDEDASFLEKQTRGTKNIEVVKGYLSQEAYNDAIRTSRFVFLPHNRLYEGKLSGIFSDCIAYGTPVISDNIEPVTEFFGSYGQMGYIYDYGNNPRWVEEFLESEDSNHHEHFSGNMKKCREDHNEDLIIRSFIAEVNG